jgi:hypothetical protein
MNSAKSLVFLASILLLSACASLTSQPAPDTPANPAVLSCLQYYRALTDIIDNNQVNDAQTIAVREYPFLHVNRFLTGLKPALDQEEKIGLWIKLAAQLALRTQNIEINNLPPEARNQLAAITPANGQNAPPAQAMQRCSRTLLEHVLSSPRSQRRILHNAKVPDDYHSWKRVVGLYPLVSFPVAAGIQQWHTESTATLKTSTAELPVNGALVRYTADTRSAYKDFAAVKSVLESARQNALRIPLPGDDTLQRLFATFAPIFEVDTVQHDDKIGAPEWQSNAPVAVVNTTRPSVYTLVSYTNFRGEILLQLNYIVWFPGRPCTSSLDYLCGHMDGITWRVTIGEDGKPLIYDTIHNCGCYHTFFPTRALQVIPPPPITVDSRISLDERAFSPIHAPHISLPQQLVLRIAHRTHYIASLYVNERAAANTVRLAWQPYDTLRSLPYDGRQDNKRRSLFAKDALVVGTQRKERWFFWPLGVPSAGAMRQWGNHATAFIGRRHFDEYDLLENAFTFADPLK